MLRALREQAGRSQLQVELEAGLGSGYLQRLESGRVAHPERDTLERVLAALGARYSERRDVLEAFGYAVSAPPPGEAEVAWARLLCARELDEATMPAYTLDCTHRLVAWNRLVAPLLGADPGTLAGQSMLAPWFDPTSLLGRLLVAPDEFLPAMLQAFRFEMRRYRDEVWSAAMLAGLLEMPAFRRHWYAVQAAPEAVGAARALVPLRVHAGGHGGPLRFRLAAEPFLRDDRFRILYFFPDDAPTMDWVQHATPR